MDNYHLVDVAHLQFNQQLRDRRIHSTLSNVFGAGIVITIIVILGITGFFGYMAGQSEELNTSFGGELDTPEIKAQGKLGEYFQTSGSQSVFKIIDDEKLNISE